MQSLYPRHDPRMTRETIMRLPGHANLDYWGNDFASRGVRYHFRVNGFCRSTGPLDICLRGLHCYLPDDIDLDRDVPAGDLPLFYWVRGHVQNSLRAAGMDLEEFTLELSLNIDDRGEQRPHLIYTTDSEGTLTVETPTIH